MNNKNIFSAQAHRRPLKSLSALGVVLALALPAEAQVRVYDSSSGQSVQQGGATGSTGSIGGIRTETTTKSTTKTTQSVQSVTQPASTTPATGGIRTDAKPLSGVAAGAKSGTNATSINQGNAATNGMPAKAVSATVDTAPNTAVSAPKKSPYVPARVQTDALGNPILTSAQNSSTTPRSLGNVIVFVNVSEFSPIVSKRINELQKLTDITPVYYMEERRPQEYVALLGPDFFEVSGKIKFKSDAGGAIAEGYGLTKAHTIIYRLPNGSVRKYSLVSEMGVFLDQLDRIRKGEST